MGVCCCRKWPKKRKDREPMGSRCFEEIDRWFVEIRLSENNEGSNGNEGAVQRLRKKVANGSVGIVRSGLCRSLGGYSMVSVFDGSARVVLVDSDGS